ncbi:MAG: hypothetical protein V4448_02135 [Pseudomonadota bacterium]
MKNTACWMMQALKVGLKTMTQMEQRSYTRAGREVISLARELDISLSI